MRFKSKFVTNEPGFNLGFSYQGTYKMGFYWAEGNYWINSDRRLKNSILPMEPVLSKLKQLTPVSYEMTAENPDHIRSIGFIAQDVRKLFPGAVRVISDFNRKGPVTNDLNTMNYKIFRGSSYTGIERTVAAVEGIGRRASGVVSRDRRIAGKSEIFLLGINREDL